MGVAGGAVLALCLWVLIASSRANEESFCWQEGACLLKSEAFAACAPLANQSACTGFDHCEWLPEGSLTDVRADVPSSELAKLAWPAAFNLSAAELACSSGLENGTCPTTCQNYLTKLGTRVVGDAFAAVCTLSTCNAAGACWDTNEQAAFKEMFRMIAETCTGQDFPSCWPAGGRCAVVDVCDGLDESICSTATLTEGGDVVCNYTSTYRCNNGPSEAPRPTSPYPEYPYSTEYPGSGGGYQDPCQYSPDDPCCGRATSFSTCVLDSPPEDSCSFYSSGCQTDYSLCSRQIDPNSCTALAESGCSWTSYPTYPTSPGPDYPSSPWLISPLPNNPGSSISTSPMPPPVPITPGAAPWQIWAVPNLPSSFFSNATDRWWNDPERSGHGPFDVLTPPIADVLLRAKASGPICEALTNLLKTMSRGMDRVCEVAGICSSTYLPVLYQISSQLDESLYFPLDPCEMCFELVDGLLPALLNDSSIDFDLVRMISAIGTDGLNAFGATCPTALEGLLWVARSYDFLPGPAQPMAAAVCPVVGAVVTAAPELLTDFPRTCALFGNPEGCIDTLAGLLEPFKGSTQAAAAQSLCYNKLPELLAPEPRYGQPQQYGEPQHYNEQYSEQNDEQQFQMAAAQYNPGYCMMSGSPSQCTAPDSASCSTIPGCRWSTTCHQQLCGEQDYWCQQRNAALPVCGPLLKLLLPASGNGDAPIPLAEVCGRMGMCYANDTNSAACNACKTATSEVISSIKYQKEHMSSWGGYGGSGIEETAFSMCSSTTSRLSAMKMQCGAFSALSASTLAASNASQICQVEASTLCEASSSDDTSHSLASPNCTFCTMLLSAYKELAATGVYSGANGLSELCYTAAQWGGNPEEMLRMQLRWRFACSPSDSACCSALPPNSYLNSTLGIGGLTPQTISQCEEQPGCTAGAYCWPAWGADTCQSLSGSACRENKQCQWSSWSSDGQQGSCVDAVLSAKCRLAGQQGGRAGCAGIRDDQGLSQCSYSQACYLDWSLRQCDESNACCLKPVDLFQPDAPQACSNGTSGNTVCDYTTQCQSRYDACNAYISKATCELGSSCAWSSMQNTGYPSSGWCHSLHDDCFDHNNDADACASNPQCRSVPRCDVSYCRPGDECCLIHSSTECATTPGCATSGWCGLVSSDCWMVWDNATCSNLAGCAWQTYNYTSPDGTSATSGWCAVSHDPCSPHSNSPIACSAVRDPQRGIPICRYQSACYDVCSSCRDCLNGVGSFISGVLPGLGGDTSLYAQAVRDFCYQGKGDYWTCYQAYQTAALHPEAVARPASMCKAIGMCSPQCVGSLDLVTCSTDGYPAGTITASALPDNVCKNSAACTSAQSCDTRNCTVLTQCDAATGFDVKSCGGTCMSKCSLLEPLLTKLNKGTCQTNEDCNVANGETCTPVVGRTCKRSVCNDDTGAITAANCAGFCSVGGTPALVSATLSDDGRQILLAFDQDVYTLSSSSPSGIFAPLTVNALGSYSQVFSQSDNPHALVVYLGWGASISPGDAMTLAVTPAIASRLNGRLVSSGATVLLEAPEEPEAPVVLLSGPASIGAGCAQGSAANIVFDASRTPFSAGRPVTFAWTFTAATSQRTTLDSLAAAATEANHERLVLPGNTVAALAAGTFTLHLTVSNWLGANASADFVFEKTSTILPVVAVIGGAEQEFWVASGIRIQTAIDLSSVCSGQRVAYEWTETSGLLPAGSFSANRNTLSVKGPVSGVTRGSVLIFSFSATLEGAGTTTALLTLTARQSSVMAVLAGPHGDVLDTRTLTFSGSGSLDPDDAANTLQPFRFGWTCTATDPATQLSTPCFTDPATAPDMTASQLVIPPGLLPAGASLYQVSLTAAKGSGSGTRSDTDTTTLRVLAGAAPTGKISRFCPGYWGCSSKLHTPSEPLRLVFALDDPYLLARTTFSWSSADISLATAASTSKQSLVVQPFTAAGTPVFVDGAQVTIDVTATADGKNASASITVVMARRPTCTALGGACLSVSPASGPVDNTSFTATASGFAADSSLFYDFGIQLPSGKTDLHLRSSTEARFTFAPRVLAEGLHTVIVCAKDLTGAQACSTSNITVQLAAQQVTAADITALGNSLTTALASGSTNALVSVVRQLSATTSAASTAASEEAQAAATEQAEQAMGAMEDLLSGEGATVEESLGMSDAASTLVAAAPELSPMLADAALNVAASAMQAVSTAGPVQASDLDSLLDIAGVCGPALLATSSDIGAGARRRLLVADNATALADEALDALIRTFDVVSGVQSTLLSSMVAGESASVGTGGLVATAALADLADMTSATEYIIGNSGAIVTLLEGFASRVESEDMSFQLMLSHQADASVLFAVVSSSTAEVPALAVGYGQRILLEVAAPEVVGALSTIVVSGYVNFTSSLDGQGTLAGQAIDIMLPLNDAYNASLATMCLRLGSSGYWRSDALELTSAANGVAHCSLSNVNNQQVVAVQYVLPEGAASDSPAPSSPSPGSSPITSPSPSPTPSSSSPAGSNSTELTVTVPQIFFIARLTAYSPQTFTLPVQQQYIAALQAASQGVNTLVSLTNIRAGSVVVDTIVQFLVSNGNSAAANNLATTLSTDPTSLLPSDVWGTVTISGLLQSEISITVPEDLLSAPTGKTSSNTTALIAGLVGGIGGAILLAGGAIAVWKMWAAKQQPVSQDLQAGFIDGTGTQPATPYTPATPSPFLTNTHGAPFACSAPLG